MRGWGFSKTAAKMALFSAITLVLTMVLAMTVANSTSQNTVSYTAEFADASGLGEGDDVRVNGVKVGKVTALDLSEKAKAQVSFEVAAARKLGKDASATVKYRNIAGQRYLALEAVVHDPNAVLAPEAVIPAERTHPALDLTELFNGFKPLFQALSPEDVNKLSFEIIQVLQGQGGTMEGLLERTASLTSTIAKKDEVIGQVIDNLNHVMGTVNARGPQLSELLDSLQQLVTGLAEQRKPVGEAVTALDELTNTTGDLVQEARPPLQRDITALNDLAGVLDKGIPKLEHDLQTLPHRLNSLTRTVSYGSWFNFYLCQIQGNIGSRELQMNVPLNPIPPAEVSERCKV